MIVLSMGLNCTVQKRTAFVEVQAGSKKIKTHYFTKDSIPVIPMWALPMPAQNDSINRGFTLVENPRHASVWQPADSMEGAYNHYSCLIFHKGIFYAMWGNHRYGEDAPGQRVLYSKSVDWGKWTSPVELMPAPGPVRPRTERGIHLKPDRWVIVNDNLYAVVYVFSPGAAPYPIAICAEPGSSNQEAFLLSGLPEKAILPGFIRQQANTATQREVASMIFAWYKKNNHISWWASGNQGVDRRAVDGAELIESFSYQASDGQQIVMLRNWGTPSNPVHNNRLYVSFPEGINKWGKAYPTNIPDSPSRCQAVRLADGTILLIGNQIAPEFDKALYMNRDPMTVSISRDGYSFDRVFVLRNNAPKTFRIPGIRGRNPGFAYSSSIVREDTLYTLYSIGKEDIGITRVPLKALGVNK